MSQREAPIHAKLRVHAEKPSVERLAEILDEHFEEFTPNPVWAPNLIAVLLDMQRQITELKDLLEAKR